MKFLLAQSVAYVIAFLYSSYFEWFLHRFFMHRPTLFHYPFRTHAQVHHQVFKADATYHLQKPEDKWLITFAWWNYPLLLVINLPVLTIPEYFGVHVLLGAALGMSTYYFLYEYLHFHMHKPGAHSFEKSRFFRFINNHHLIHHKFMHRNLNIVLPLADLTFGTLLLRPKQPLDGAPVLRPSL